MYPKHRLKTMALKPAEHFPCDLPLFPKFAMVTINVFIVL